MHRREVLILGAGLVLSGCVAEPAVQAANASELQVTSVGVALASPASIEEQLERWNIGVTKERLITDTRMALQRELALVSRNGKRQVSASFTLTEIKLDSAIPGLIKPVFVGLFSTITGQLQIADARTGEVLIRRYVIGDDNPGDMTLGAAMKSGFSAGKPLLKAYTDVVDGFAEDVAREIFLKDRGSAS